MGLFEILIIAVVTLLVVGPERMPEAVRSIALTVGRIKRTLQSAKSEIEEQIGADEIRRQLHNEEIMANRQANYHTEQHDIPSAPISKAATSNSSKSSHTVDTSS